jgi:glucose-6-phosphate 1-dehydrogenase
MKLADTQEPADVTRYRATGPCVMVIFGAAGDLTRRKLLPALLNLRRAGVLGDAFGVVAVARAPVEERVFVEQLLGELDALAAAPTPPADREWIASRLRYSRGDFDDPDTFGRLRETLQDTDARLGTQGNYLYYLATPPAHFTTIASALARVDLTAQSDGHWRRIVVEKPFGVDLSSARSLNRALAAAFDESQIYRIDHYLGKETVQNLMVLRFANGIFEPVWNRRYVDHVQITVAETVGVEDRGGYYETAGALRDMVQNHLFQLLALVAMEPPNSFEADAVRDERVKVLQAIHPFGAEDVERYAVRGQYAEGALDGGHVAGYRQESRVDPRSITETFVALRLRLENWRWADVPFYLRTGKRLPKRVSEIAIQFKCAPVIMFREEGIGQLEPNLLIVRIQPDEGISLRFAAKVPAPGLQLGAVEMDFNYADYFGSTPATGYETLLYDCMHGDATQFHRADMVETGWHAVMPILDAWRHGPARGIPTYAAGTWGPDEAVELMARDRRKWRRP